LDRETSHGRTPLPSDSKLHGLLRPNAVLRTPEEDSGGPSRN
jgi:hypothetical protein